MFKTKKFWYILLFSILYLVVAGSSFFHAIAFFGLANNLMMSVILAFAFEVGQAAVLFSLLTSAKDRSRIMPWILMSMFTLVQVIGNIYSSYKYIMMNSVENLRYFKEPIFIWTQLPDDQATVIITYVVGAILPIASLLLTSMITNYLSDQEELKNEQKSLEQKEAEIKPIVESVRQDLNDVITEEKGEDEMEVLADSLNSKDKEIEQPKDDLEENETEKDESNNDTTEQFLGGTETEASTKSDIDETSEEDESGGESDKRQSHFINL